jgi:hypothetical protein
MPTKPPREKETITFEPTSTDELSTFLEANKDKYHEIWIVLTKKEVRKSSTHIIF